MNPEVLGRMVECLYHRGPDSSGFFYSDAFNAGMRRLSINDLSGGDQPLYSEDKSIIVFYNGEIYNYPQLREELETKGYRFRSRSDGEVICHLYLEYQEDLFEKLDGMFAVALWSKKEQKLILARDIPGEKPLYYIKLNKNEIVFASEIKSLLEFPGWDHKLNTQALWDFPSFLWIPEPTTIYDSVKAIPRGHTLVADIHGIHLRPYKNLFNQKTLNVNNEQEVIEETRRVVSEAIESRLLSDVPLGSFLSGGLDSSIVATVAAKHLPSLDTFNIGFENLSDPYHGKADESEYAEEFAKHLGSRHHSIRVTADDFKQDLLKFCIHADQPFSVSSGLGILSVARSAQKEGIKVLLSGDCADECFGGYSWYFHLNDFKYDTQTEDVTQKNISFQNFGLPIKKRLSVLKGYSSQTRAWAWHYYAAELEKEQLYTQEYFQSTHSSLKYFEQFKADPWEPEDFIRQDREFYLPNEMLRKLDRMTMAYSVEGRVPFAAPSVLAHADKLKLRHMVQGNSLKWVLRKAFASDLPKHICSRPKHGFNIPIDHWLKKEWNDLFEKAFSPNSALMKQGIIHKKSRDYAFKMLHDPIRLNGHTLFSFIMLNMWLENIYENHC